MTLPDERYRAIMNAKKLCEDLIDPKKTPRTPKYIRRQASGVLRHFPDEYFLSLLADARPDILERREEPFEPLYKMVKEYSLGKTNE
jgi:hypothetical protein